MGITQRSYRILTDFERVSDFLRENYTQYLRSGNILQPFWEYAHCNRNFDYKMSHRFGVYEENGEIVAVAGFEMRLGQCYLMTKIGYEYLKPALIRYAEKELFQKDGNRKKLDVWIFDYENQVRETLCQMGYQMESSEPVTVFKYENGFRERKLPEGFSVGSLEDENDLYKIHRVLWRGFGHGDEPDGNLDGRRFTQSAPHFRKDLTTVIKAPNGDYACYAGMWLDEVNHYAYLEPLATDPDYRRMGLATIALTEAMRETEKSGAGYCFGGPGEFYFKIGFEAVCHMEKWSKAW